MIANEVTPSEGHALMPVESLKAGYQVDLAGDPFADQEDPSILYEYAVVESVEEETDECTAVVFDSTWIGFPRGHLVVVRLDGFYHPNQSERI